MSRARDSIFLARTSLTGFAAFLAAGIFDYTYGHSLGLILLSFVVLAPHGLRPREDDAGWRVEIERGSAHRTLTGVDRIGGLLLSAISLPVLIPAATVIHLLSRRSPFIAHLRVGQDGRAFWVWKLRTMWPRGLSPTAEEAGWVQRIDRDPDRDTKRECDPRVSSGFARFCRRYSIDELPQFFHVLRGEMSLVGPRPLTRGELARHYGANASEVLALKPGLTGYWQTRGRNRLSYAERVAFDLQLARELSAGVYFQLLLRTIPQVLRGENAW
jgi:lipopolysaccharide/colanic/teichoic acid biosynthesis glycosyltransferase